jgi:hypothetical protein
MSFTIDKTAIGTIATAVKNIAKPKTAIYGGKLGYDATDNKYSAILSFTGHGTNPIKANIDALESYKIKNLYVFYDPSDSDGKMVKHMYNVKVVDNIPTTKAAETVYIKSSVFDKTSVIANTFTISLSDGEIDFGTLTDDTDSKLDLTSAGDDAKIYFVAYVAVCNFSIVEAENDKPTGSAQGGVDDDCNPIQPDIDTVLAFSKG